MGSIPGSGRCPGGGHGNPLQYSCLENPTERGASWATVHGVAESDVTEHSMEFSVVSVIWPLPRHSSSPFTLVFLEFFSFSGPYVLHHSSHEDCDQPEICFSSLFALVSSVYRSDFKYHHQRLSLIFRVTFFPPFILPIILILQIHKLYQDDIKHFCSSYPYLKKSINIVLICFKPFLFNF